MNKVNYEKMLDVIFDGVTDESFKKRYYGRSFNNEYIRRSNILNGFTCVNVPNEMYMDITIQRCTVVKDDDPNDTTPMTVHINFYKQTIPERYVINKLYDTEFSLKRWFEGCYTTTKRTYRYTVNNEKDALKVRKAIENHIEWFNTQIENICNVLNSLEINKMATKIQELENTIKEAEQIRDDYVNKCVQTFKNVLNLAKDM
jgi:Asp-tRNA(Asn)/Glu-tRNA(Gln) amidotransferase C subunit